jgi:hypothetical protein
LGNKSAQQHRSVLGHPPNKPTRVLVLDKRQPNAHVPAALAGAAQVFCDLIKANVAMNYLEKQLDGALHPDIKAPDARCLDNDSVIQIPQGGIFEPRHQKSSADGMRL